MSPRLGLDERVKAEHSSQIDYFHPLAKTVWPIAELVLIRLRWHCGVVRRLVGVLERHALSQKIAGISLHGQGRYV